MPRTLALAYPYPHSIDGGDDIPLSPASSTSSFDEEDVNVRMAPNWCTYRHLLEIRGVRLDTCRDVKQWYQDYWDRQLSQGYHVTEVASSKNELTRLYLQTRLLKNFIPSSLRAAIVDTLMFVLFWHVNAVVFLDLTLGPQKL